MKLHCKTHVFALDVLFAFDVLSNRIGGQQTIIAESAVFLASTASQSEIEGRRVVNVNCTKLRLRIMAGGSILTLHSALAWFNSQPLQPQLCK